MSIADKLVTIAEKLPKVYHAGQLNVLANAESLNGSLSGKGVSANDVIDIEHNVACAFENPNLVDISTYTLGGGDDASVTINGSTVEVVSSADTNTDVMYNFALDKGTYRLVIDVTNAQGYMDTSLKINESNQKVDTVWDGANNSCKVESIFVLTQTSDISIIVSCTTMSLMNFDLKLVRDFSSVKVSRYGKNLLDYESDAGKNPSETVNGVYNAKFITNSKSAWYGYLDIDTLPDVFTVSTFIRCEDYGSTNSTRTSLRLYVYDESKKQLQILTGTNATDKNPRTSIVCDKSSLPDGAKYIWLNIRINSEGYVENSQIELGTTATAYEPYIEPTTYTANADGTVDGITSIAPNMTLLTDTEGVVINANYYKDPDIVISNIAQNVALTGGE